MQNLCGPHFRRFEDMSRSRYVQRRSAPCSAVWAHERTSIANISLNRKLPSPVHRLRARHAAEAPHSHLSKVYSHLKTAEWRPARRPRARRARAERACPSQLPLALQAARGPQGRCVGHCCCATPLVLVDTRASRAAFAAVPKRCSARRDTARWSGIRAAMPLSLRESTRATSRTRHAIGRQRRSRR